MTQYKHWKIDIDSEHVVWLGFDRNDRTVNAINTEALDELNSILQEMANHKHARGLILYSLKDKGFIAGADINEFSAFHTPSQVAEFLRKGQAVFSRLEALPFPTVAMIHGFCLGGGLELALACDYRIASDDAETRLGLPETMLGIHPGWGGSVRLPRLIGGFNALSKVILPGIPMAAAKAKKIGFVDEVVPLRQLRRAACYFINNKPAKHKPGFISALSNYGWFRPLLALLLRKNLSKRVKKDQYPAYYAVVDLWEKDGGQGERAYLKEADSVLQLINNSETATNLIRVFQLRERLKGFAKTSSKKIQKVHVIGAGTMGGDIAMWCAYRGLNVSLQDTSYERIGVAVGRAQAFYTKKLRHARLVQAAMDRLQPDPTGLGLADADLIIEAVFEDLKVKQTLMKQIEKSAKNDAIIATNTSSIPLDDISTAMIDPSRLVGIHYFNPVAKMELVEVVGSKKTSKKVIEAALTFVVQIGRLPLPVQSSPGFLVNRVLMPYLLECVQLLEEGYSAEIIDKAATDFGMMMGPVEMADTVGLDVCLAVAENLTQHFGGNVPHKLRDLVKAGKLGRKTGEGFYCYKKGKPIKKKIKSDETGQEISQRLILRMLNESYACLREDVVADADLLDAGMIFASGFAPFRGGPMHYASQFGRDKLNALFMSLENQYGTRFKQVSVS